MAAHTAEAAASQGGLALKDACVRVDACISAQQVMHHQKGSHHIIERGRTCAVAVLNRQRAVDVYVHF